MPPGGGITGNGSVRWFIDMDKAEEGSTRVDPRNKIGLHLEGADKRNEREFVITIKLPRGEHRDARKKYVEQLERQLEAAKGGAKETRLTIPVEGVRRRSKYTLYDYQITVTW